jgi:aminoglycoside phosphotransferase (APT) family kinase protein
MHPFILSSTGAKNAREVEHIQELWSGYGTLVRYELDGCAHTSAIVKHVKPPKNPHPRKLRSYEVEKAWYTQWAKLCDETCRVPKAYGMHYQKGEFLFVLEDLDAAGFPMRKRTVNENEFRVMLDWLANFHATFLGQKPQNLWKTGTYWHLDTRLDELKALNDAKLSAKAHTLDQALKGSAFQTFVHGDAKLQNFCFSKDGKSVAAVDFQYVGGGCGMKDVAYLLDSCFSESACKRMEQNVLDYYFASLKKALAIRQSTLHFSALEADWRPLYQVAWDDFQRFLRGWNP